MIRVRLQLNGDKEPKYTDTEHGLIYVASDDRFDAPIKPFEKTSYPEQSGENIYNKTVSDAFDYKVTWLITANKDLGYANSIIQTFNSKLFTVSNGIKTFHNILFYNDYKRVGIIGIPSPISEATEFWRDINGNQHDVVKVEWTIRVNDPDACVFNLDE